jgi:hypothetical protein
MEGTSQMKDASPGEVVKVPSPIEEDKHPLLQKDITIATSTTTRGSLPSVEAKKMTPSNKLIYISSARSAFI